ncbi:MAG: hypothetical protein M1421_02855 [Candidatus Eremiobacteraeota bacterium]|nr:hypothetical protein [Candidatus Eremiobacteraeota bacterium]
MNFKRRIQRFLIRLSVIGRQRSALFAAVILCLAAGIVLILTHHKEIGSYLSSAISSKQTRSPYSLSHPPVLSLPPPAPILSPTPFSKLAPLSAPPAPLRFISPPVGKLKKAHIKLKHKIQSEKKPTKWQILQEYDQVIVLSEKYYDIAVKSDQYGYKRQAILYYKKYLFVAPDGSHASQIRSRLHQLESSY